LYYSQSNIENFTIRLTAIMATNKSKPKSATKKTVVKKTVVAKKRTAKQIIDSVKRKSVIAKPKKTSKAVIPKPIQLNEEHEARVAEWRAQELAKEGFIEVWAKKLATTAKKVRDLNQQYHKILYKQLQDAYEVYDNVLRSEHCDDFFANLRGAMYTQGFKIQSNTTDSALIIRFIFGIDTQTKTVHDYSRALDGARYDSVDTDKFAEWLERKTITKVIEEQRAIKREIETPAERLDRARRVVLRMLEIRETKPIIKFTTIEHTAERQLLGRELGLCVMLGYAYRKFGRGDDALDVDINLNFLLPPSLDFEIVIIDKLARYIIRDVEKYEAAITDAEEQQWAEDVWERLVASCDAEVEKNKEYWANRQQAQRAEDQYEFAKLVKERKRNKK
jgi:hypothetical protein